MCLLFWIVGLWKCSCLEGEDWRCVLHWSVGLYVCFEMDVVLGVVFWG